MRSAWLVLLVLIPAGCGRSAKVEPPAKAPATDSKSYPIVGVVREVKAKEGRLTLKHEAIPDYMPAMTMTLRVASADLSTLEDLRAGDKVSATLKVDGTHSELTEINVTEPAPPAELVLDPATMSLRERPKKLEPGEQVPDFLITTQDGSALKLSDLRGKAVVLTFVYSRCGLPEFCPKMVAKFSELSRVIASSPMSAAKIRLLSISFDPEHDTPDVLTKHAVARGANPPLWQFAVMSHEELANVGGRLGLTYGPMKGEIIHNLSTALIDPDGKLIAIYGGSGWMADAVYQTLRASLAP